MRGDIQVHSVMAESCLTKDYLMMCRYTYLIIFALPGSPDDAR